MSNAIRQMKRRNGRVGKGKKPRGTRHQLRGPAKLDRLKPAARELDTPKGEDGKDMKPDLSLADPSCSYCHGTGVCGETKQKDKSRVYLLCTCVNRAMHDKGDVPWLGRKQA